MVADAHFAIKAGEGSRARDWRLTWPAVAGKQGPSREYEQLEPAPKKPARNRMERGRRALKRCEQSQSEEKSAVGTLPTHLLNSLDNSTPMAVTRTAKKNGREPVWNTA